MLERFLSWAHSPNTHLERIAFAFAGGAIFVIALLEKVGGL